VHWRISKFIPISWKFNNLTFIIFDRKIFNQHPALPSKHTLLIMHLHAKKIKHKLKNSCEEEKSNWENNERNSNLIAWYKKYNSNSKNQKKKQIKQKKKPEKHAQFFFSLQGEL
jgi:hypothetical protein